ncbi:MAG: 3-isopropylmalate dehydratase small subunit [Gemmatimonadota bacterium]
MRAVVFAIDNIDTDQIIPARFLTVTGKDQLGDALFADWQQRPEKGAEILIAGRNFGCGSSREHAVWALQSFGFRAVISTDFADIFRNNALGNGLLPIELAPDEYRRVTQLCVADPATELTIDLAAQTVTTPDGQAAHFPIDPFAKHCLQQGTDALGYLLSAEADIAKYEAAHAS